MGGTAITTILQSCVSTYYFAPTNIFEDQIVIKKTEYNMIVKDKLVERKYVLVNQGNHDYPICIYKLDKENYSAILMECTHKGCELRPQEDYLVCPCHGSEFTMEGIVQNPPAEQNLKTFKIKTDNENIYIQL